MDDKNQPLSWAEAWAWLTNARLIRFILLFVLAWATQIERILNFEMECPETLAGALPDVEVSGSSSALRKRAVLSSRSALNTTFALLMPYWEHLRQNASTPLQRRNPQRFAGISRGW